MNRTIRLFAATASLGFASGAIAGPAYAADLLEAPVGTAALTPDNWTPTVARSYEKQYTGVHCVAATGHPTSATAYDLGTPPSGQWMFAVTIVDGKPHQYGPAELDRTVVHTPATDVIGCYGTPVVKDGVAFTPGARPGDPTIAAPSATPSSVPAGLDGGKGGLGALGAGVLAVLALAALGLRARRSR